MTVYYNEIDPFCAQWLRNLIAAGHIAPGDVDERSIEDVRPDDLSPFTQCHFFAGIGVWSHSLRLAGWDDMQQVWTGSCPCQPFSAAGKGLKFDDERHLWPAWFHLIGECKPSSIFGEQVAGKNGLAWLDLVQADMESLDYACGAVPAPAAGFGAPHIRERLYWVAYSNDAGLQGWNSAELQERAEQRPSGPRSSQSGLGHTESKRRERRENDGDEGRRECPSGQAGEAERLEHTARDGWQQRGPESGGRSAESRRELGGLAEPKGEQRNGSGDARRGWREPANRSDLRERPSPTNGVWRDADWLGCTDGKWRPVEPGTFPLVDGVASRVGRLRAYGNAIVASQAQAFIEAAMAYRP